MDSNLRTYGMFPPTWRKCRAGEILSRFKGVLTQWQCDFSTLLKWYRHGDRASKKCEYRWPLPQVEDFLVLWQARKDFPPVY